MRNPYLDFSFFINIYSFIMTDKTGAIYDGNNNYYGEHIQYVETVIGDEEDSIKCKADSSLSLNRIIEIIKSKNENAKIDIKLEDDGFYILFNDNDYDIYKLRRYISFFDGLIGKKSILDCVYEKF